MKKLNNSLFLDIYQKTSHVETVKSLFRHKRLNVNRQLNQFLHRETELIVYYRIHICTVFEFSIGAPLCVHLSSIFSAFSFIFSCLRLSRSGIKGNTCRHQDNGIQNGKIGFVLDSDYFKLITETDAVGQKLHDHLAEVHSIVRGI